MAAAADGAPQPPPTRLAAEAVLTQSAKSQGAIVLLRLRPVASRVLWGCGCCWQFQLASFGPDAPTPPEFALLAPFGYVLGEERMLLAELGAECERLGVTIHPHYSPPSPTGETAPPPVTTGRWLYYLVIILCFIAGGVVGYLFGLIGGAILVAITAAIYSSVWWALKQHSIKHAATNTAAVPFLANIVLRHAHLFSRWGLSASIIPCDTSVRRDGSNVQLFLCVSMMPHVRAYWVQQQQQSGGDGPSAVPLFRQDAGHSGGAGAVPFFSPLSPPPPGMSVNPPQRLTQQTRSPQAQAALSPSQQQQQRATAEWDVKTAGGGVAARPYAQAAAINSSSTAAGGSDGNYYTSSGGGGSSSAIDEDPSSYSAATMSASDTVFVPASAVSAAAAEALQPLRDIPYDLRHHTQQQQQGTAAAATVGDGARVVRNPISRLNQTASDPAARGDASSAAGGVDSSRAAFGPVDARR